MSLVSFQYEIISVILGAHGFICSCRVYKLLNVLEFNSSRKRMSVIVRDHDGKLLLLSKGADK